MVSVVHVRVCAHRHVVNACIFSHGIIRTCMCVCVWTCFMWQKYCTMQGCVCGEDRERERERERAGKEDERGGGL